MLKDFTESVMKHYNKNDREIIKIYLQIDC
jgi:hypothetical protein